jgi:hypothetical protein
MVIGSSVTGFVITVLFGIARTADVVINFGSANNFDCLNGAASDAIVLDRPSGSCMGTPYSVGSTRIIQSGNDDCVVNFFRDSNCNSLIRQIDSVAQNDGCLTWGAVVDGTQLPDPVNGWSFSCNSLSRRGATRSSRRLLSKAKRQPNPIFPTLENGSTITGGTGNGAMVTYQMTDVEANNDQAGTGVIASLIPAAAQAVADAINADAQNEPTIGHQDGFGGVVTLDLGVNVSWNIEATSTTLTFGAVSLDAVIVMINEGLELALEENMDGFNAVANGNNGNNFMLDIFFAKQ